MNKKTIIWILVIAVILIGAILIVKKAQKKDETAPLAVSYPVVVSSLQLQKDNVQLSLPYLAITQNDKDVNLASKIAARIEYIKPSSSKVKIGDIIAKLDISNISSNIKSVEAQSDAIATALKNLQATHKRTLELLAVKGASVEQSSMEESKLAELQSKKIALAQKHIELDNMLTYAVIKSPVDGRISKTMANTGDMAMPGHPLAQLKAENGFYLLLRVPTDLNVTGVKLRNKRYDALALNSTFHGLAEYKVYVNESNLVSGDRIEADVEIFNGNAIQLPFDAVLNRNGKSFVLLRDNKQAKAYEVHILQSGEQGLVISNLELDGKEIVVAKQDILLKLLSGASLKIKGE